MWIQAAGFNYRDKVVLFVSPGRLVIDQADGAMKGATKSYKKDPPARASGSVPRCFTCSGAARLRGFEPPTSGFVVRYSIQLSYRRNHAAADAANDCKKLPSIYLISK